ncbi:MAG: hypothetical protein P8O03_12520 [Ilumatobacter sp.]|nr:hypothetical protein [Ilumatobacter sp.]
MTSPQPNVGCDPAGRRRRWGAAAVVAALSLGTLSACGSDGESPEDAFCDAAVSLQTNIEGIADVDIISGGTDAVTDQVEAIQSDVVQLRNSGSDVAADEISALGTAVDDLAAALDALGSDTSVDSAQAVVSSAGAVVVSAGAVYNRFDSVCL